MACCHHCDGSLQTLFESALQRRHWQGPCSHWGRSVDERENLAVLFYLNVRGEHIEQIDYRATTCATLLAYCELLTRMAAGLRPAEALGLRAGDLVRRVRGVPPARRARAALALAALHDALLANQTGKD